MLALWTPGSQESAGSVPSLGHSGKKHSENALDPPKKKSSFPEDKTGSDFDPHPCQPEGPGQGNPKSVPQSALRSALKNRGALRSALESALKFASFTTENPSRALSGALPPISESTPESTFGGFPDLGPLGWPAETQPHPRIP